MLEALITSIVIFTLATFLGVELINRVPTMLHTPLMSGANAISGITIVGALIMSVIRSGCSQMGLANWVQDIVTGGIIVLAVALDRLRHRRAA